MDPNDFWIGDNAWLLTALKQHRVVTGDQRYNGRITMLVNWFNCLENLTPAPGIYSGFRKDGSLMNWRHAEGSIDVYGALKGLNAEPVRVSVKTWLDDAVWPCGPARLLRRRFAQPRQLADRQRVLGHPGARAGLSCLLQHAEARTARTQDRYLVETFDRFTPGNWITATMTSNTSIHVNLARQQAGPAQVLACAMPGTTRMPGSFCIAPRTFIWP